MPAARKPFTSRELAIIREAPGNARITDVATQLGRGVRSVRKEARRLGVDFRSTRPPCPRQEGSRRSLLLRALAEGPATSSELGAELGISTKLALAYLRDLERQGHVRSRPFEGQSRSLWELARRVEL